MKQKFYRVGKIFWARRAKFFGLAPARPEHLHAMIAATFGANTFYRKRFSQFGLMNKFFLAF
jgi:hypothetical protein